MTRTFVRDSARLGHGESDARTQRAKHRACGSSAPVAVRRLRHSGAAPEGWYEAELLEWIHFPTSGWTGLDRYRTSLAGGYVGHFAPENIKGVSPPS